MSKNGDFIYWVLERTNLKKSQEYFRSRKLHSKKKDKKRSIDKDIKFCIECKMCWSYVTKYMNPTKFTRYPKGVIPSLGKKRSICKICKRKKNENNKNKKSKNS